MDETQELGAREYKRLMDELAAGVLEAQVLTEDISAEEIRRLKATISRAESMAFLMVPPLEHGAALDRLDGQRKVIAAIEACRAVAVSQGG